MKVDSTIFIGADELTRGQWRKLLTSLTFLDDKGREVRAYKQLSGGVRIHRGSWNLLPDSVVYFDDRVMPEGRRLTFRKQLDTPGFSGQKKALEEMKKQEQGQIVCQPGWGKTQVALAFAAQAGTPTIVFVHTEDIFNQWVQYARESIPGAKIGTIRGAEWVHGDITIAMVQTVSQNLQTFRTGFANRYGVVIVDESHHAPANSWEQILNSLPAYFRFGFTATSTRADGLHPLIKHLIGPAIYKHPIELKVDTRVIPIFSNFFYAWKGPWDWADLQTSLIHDRERNAIIANRVLMQLKKNHSCLVLSKRIDHLKNLQEMIGDEAVILTGKIGRARRLEIIEQFRSGEIKCLLATQLADEALDIPRLSRVFLTYPGKHDGKVIQQVGRALREHEDKNDAIIFDVVDKKVRVLHRQWPQRKRAYDRMKIKVKKSKDADLEVVSAGRAQRERMDRIKKRMRRSI